MIDVIRFIDVRGIGMFQSDIFDSDEYHTPLGWRPTISDSLKQERPHLYSLIRMTNDHVRVPSGVGTSMFEGAKFMYRASFLFDHFDAHGMLELYNQCCAAGLKIRYGRIKETTPWYEDEHQVVVPQHSIAKMRQAHNCVNTYEQFLKQCERQYRNF